MDIAENIINNDLEKNSTETPKETSCPNVQDTDLIQHLKEKYGLTVRKVTRLNGYYASNFHVIVEKFGSNPNITDIASGGYIVKVSNINDSKQTDYLNAQLSVMKHFVNKGINCQESLRSLHNEEFTDIHIASKSGEKGSHKLSLRSYLPGEVVAKFTLTPKLLYNIGVFTAKCHQALEDFYNPFYDHFEVPLWSMNFVPEAANYTCYVTNEKHRVICGQVLKAFDDDVLPIKNLFRKGQIHGDLNEGNILAQEVEGKRRDVEVCGLLDFEHSAYSNLVYNVIMVAAYMMMCPNTDVARPLIPGYILAGYASRLQLNEAEKLSYHTLVACRMVMSLVYGAYHYSLDPSNDYCLETARHGWDALVAFWKMPKNELEKDWTQIINSYTQ